MLLDKLKPCTFKYNGTDKISHGFIAQDLLEIFPDNIYSMVSKDNKGYYMVDYSQLIPLLCLELQKLNKRVEELEKDK